MREFWQEREAERLERLALDLDYESDYIYGFLYWKDDPEEAEQREKEEERLSCYDDCDDDRYMGRYDDPLFEDLY